MVARAPLSLSSAITFAVGSVLVLASAACHKDFDGLFTDGTPASVPPDPASSGGSSGKTPPSPDPVPSVCAPGETCKLSCSAGAPCDVACPVNGMCFVTCERGAECTCTGDGCDLSCTIDLRPCGPGLFACNRECPK